MKVVGFAGFSGSGKTTLVEQLIPEMRLRGLRVSVVKHAHHSFDIDHVGKDTWRHREAGASEVAVVSRYRWALMHELGGTESDEPTLDDILDKLEPCDLVLVEGYKRDSHLKIEVRRVGAKDQTPLAADDRQIVAIATDHPVADATVPVFALDDVAGIADFIARQLGLPDEDRTEP